MPDMTFEILSPSADVTNALVWTMMHSIWQFLVIAIIMSVLLKRYAADSAAKRYNIATFSLLSAFITSIVTFLYYFSATNGPEATTTFQGIQWQVTSSSLPQDFSFNMMSWIEQNQQFIFYTWITGVILFSIRFLFSALYIEFLSSVSQPLYCQDTYRAFRKVCQHYNVKHKINIGVNKHITTPMILGFIKPIILFPVGMVNQLDIKETEAILAHELAHYVRKDLYVNVIQNLIEVLLFYHPAIWWISANIKLERESSCDNMATAYLGDKILYAKTLVKIQELAQHQMQPAFALYFSKKESYFSNRIKRILNMTQTRNYLKEKIFTTVFLVLIMMMVTKSVVGSTENNNADKKQFLSQNIGTVEVDTLPQSRSSVKIQKKTNDRDYKISMEDGKITELEVDGKKIEEKDYNKYDDIIAEVKPDKTGKGSSRMFFFDGDGERPNVFRFGFGDQDSFWHEFKTLKEFPMHSFEFNNKEMDEKIKKLFEDNKIKMDEWRENFDQNKLRDFNKSFGFSEDQLNKMLKELGSLPLKLKNLDSLNSGFKVFRFPDHNSGDGNGFHFNFGDDFDEIHTPESKSNNFSEIIGNALNRDGLLIPGEENKVELTGKHLKINGEKQPNNIFQKYKRIFEETSGATLEKNSKLQFSFTGKESKRKYKVY